MFASKIVRQKTPFSHVKSKNGEDYPNMRQVLSPYGDIFFIVKSRIRKTRGKIAAEKRPVLSPVCSGLSPIAEPSSCIFWLFSAICAIIPVSQGPIEHPISPASAQPPNNAVPPPGNLCAAIVNIPGHIILIENPHSAQPPRAIIGEGARRAQR